MSRYCFSEDMLRGKSLRFEDFSCRSESEGGKRGGPNSSLACLRFMTYVIRAMAL